MTITINNNNEFNLTNSEWKSDTAFRNALASHCIVRSSVRIACHRQRRRLGDHTTMSTARTAPSPSKTTQRKNVMETEKERR